MARRRRPPPRIASGLPELPRTAYVETSVWGMTAPNQPSALRQPTLEFLRQCAAGLFVPYISSIVLDEINLAPQRTTAQIVREINRLAPRQLEPDDKTEELADVYLRAGIVPAGKRDDARHVALATIAGLDILVSWNHRHMVNERKRALFNAANRLAGYDRVLAILTPFEVMS